MKNKVYKLFVMLICVLFVFSLAPAVPLYVKAEEKAKDNDGFEYKTTYFYLWNKAEGGTIESILGTDPNVMKPIFIVGKNNGTDRRYLKSTNSYTTKNNKHPELIEYYNSTSFYENRYFSDTKPFLTKSAAGAFFTRYAGQTPEWKDVPSYHFLYPNYDDSAAGTLALAPDQSTSCYFERRETNGSATSFWAIPRWSITNLSKYTVPSSGNVKIFCSNPDTYDQWISLESADVSDGEMPMFCVPFYNSLGEWSKFDNLEIWVGTPVKYNVIDWHHTVQTGQVFNIDDNVLIKEGGSLTIEKGAAVSVNGQLFNNGKIYNHGTLVIQDKSAISAYDSREKTELICDGGDIVMLKGSKMYFDQQAKFTMKNGATLVNSGSLVSFYGMDISDSTWDIRENGCMFLNYGLYENVSQIKDLELIRGDYPYLKGMSGSAMELSHNDQFKPYTAREAVWLRGNTKIINRGYIRANNCVIVNSWDSLQYVERDNGKLVQTNTAVTNNATVTYFSNSHPKYKYNGGADSMLFNWDDFNNIVKENTAQKKFYVEYNPK